jgi:hypothetical protein
MITQMNLLGRYGELLASTRLSTVFAVRYKVLDADYYSNNVVSMMQRLHWNNRISSSHRILSTTSSSELSHEDELLSALNTQHFDKAPTVLSFVL